MKIYYYCSYKFSPTGFQLICYDEQNGNVIPYNGENEEDKLIHRFFSHGGIESAFGRLRNGKYYFLIKQLKLTDENLSENEMGKTWNINFAVSAEESELQSLCAVACMAYTNAVGFTNELYDTLSLGDEQLSFNVDILRFKKTVQNALTAAGSGSAQSSTPYDLDPRLFSEAIAILKAQSIKHKLEFVVLSADTDYFYENCKVIRTEKIWHGFSLNGEKLHHNHESDSTAQASHTADAAAYSNGGIFAIAVIGTIVLGTTIVIASKVFGRRGRK